MELIFASFRGDADDRARSLSILWTVGVAQHFEFSDGIRRGINQDRSVRTNVVVVHAVDQEQVVRIRIAVYGKVAAAGQALTYSVKVFRGRNARRQGHQA